MRRTYLTRIAAAAACGRRDELRGLYRAALDDGVSGADLLEATLQVFLFAGYPRTIDAFEELRGLVDVPAHSEPPRDKLEERGMELFGRIYGRHTDKVRAWLTGLHPDFARFLLHDAYGQVMTRPFLPALERELMAVSMLAAMGLFGQLKAHVRGAVRCGATADDVRGAAAEADEKQRALIETTLESLVE